MKAVLDTNIILSCISRKSPYHFVLEALFAGLYTLYLTTEILLEYEEKLTENFSSSVSENFIGALLITSNIRKVEIYFDLNIIKSDLDDNKFVNCAFAANANYLVSNDRHFNVLKDIKFPKINLLTVEEFMQILQQD